MTRRQRSLHLPTLQTLARREVELFRGGGTSDDTYADLRAQWPALRGINSSAAVRALASLIGARLGVSVIVVTPIVATLIDPGE